MNFKNRSGSVKKTYNCYSILGINHFFWGENNKVGNIGQYVDDGHQRESNPNCSW